MGEGYQRIRKNTGGNSRKTFIEEEIMQLIWLIDLVVVLGFFGGVGVITWLILKKI